MNKSIVGSAPHFMSVGRRSSIAAGMCLIAFIVSGCSHGLSGAGPARDDIEGKNTAYDLVDINADTIAPFMRPAPQAPLRVYAPPKMKTLRLMSGDQINVLITDNAPQGTGLFAPLATGGTRLTVRIDAQGMISLPYVGHQSVKGMTPTEVETMICQRLKGVTSDVQAHVELVGERSGSVLVAGAVKSPGRFSTLQGPLTLLDAINQAGGPLVEPHLVNVTLRAGGQVTTLNYEDVLTGSDQPLEADSQVIVERARQRFVAMGAVGTPGLHDLPAQNTSLLDALGVVGGLKEGNANPSGVFVFRMGNLDNARPTVMRIDMREPAAIFYAQQVILKPDDTIYVTNAAVYEWQKIIGPLVQTLVLGRAVGVGP